MTNANLQTLEELAKLTPPDPDDRVILERIIKLAAKHLPEGWRQWKAFEFSRDGLLGKDYDPHILNKIRFALPTVGLVQAFNPEAAHVSEKGYRELKLKMLIWPFCIGLIIRPSSLASTIRGSTAQNELVLAALSDLKPLMVSQKDAARQLSSDAGSIDGEDSIQNSRRFDRESRSVSVPRQTEQYHIEADQSRIDKLEKTTDELKIVFQSLMESSDNFKENICLDGIRLEGYPVTEEAEDEDSDEENAAGKIPPLLDIDLEDSYVDANKRTRAIHPPAKPHVESQGIDCLRLGKSSFHRVRYADVHKKLQASPVFNALQINSQISHMAPHNAILEHLTKTDLTLGTNLQGLLQQRDSFSEALKLLIAKHPTIKRDVQELLVGPDSKFKQYSDDVLQYVSGRRSEVIEQRRKCFFLKHPQLSSLLENILPSTTHLFAAEPLAEMARTLPPSLL